MAQLRNLGMHFLNEFLTGIYCGGTRGLWQRHFRRIHPTFRLLVEQLEDRCVPAIFVVNELVDTHAVSLISGKDAAGNISLRSAIEAADHLGGRQTIQFDPSAFATQQTIPLNLGALSLRGSVSGLLAIDGPDAGVILSGNDAHRVLAIAAGTHVSLTNLTIRDGAVSGNGGGIFNAGILTLQNCTITANTATGPIASWHSDLGGGIFSDGALTIHDSTISGNNATWGGGISIGFPGYASGSLTVTDSTISGNSATLGGGAIANGGTTVLAGDTLADNTSGECGGAIWDVNRLTIRDSTISGNTAGAGGGVYVNGTANFFNSKVSGNTASTPTSDAGGGGVFGRSGIIVFDHCDIDDNTSVASAGGGIENLQATLSLRESTLSGNIAGGGGGAIDNEGTLSLRNCTISGNSAQGCGGGICTAVYPYAPSQDPALVNCTISGNTAGVDGGGIFVDWDNEVNLHNCTIADNTAVHGGGICNQYGFLTLSNTIVAANTSTAGDGDLVGPVMAPSFNNLIGDGTGSRGLRDLVNGNHVGTHAAPIDPLLAPLADNGGPTQTMALLLGSLAIDAGRNTAVPVGVTTDQRGHPRVINGIVDIGAFEFTPPDQAAAITSAGNATFTVGLADTFKFTTTGYPRATLTEVGMLPAGLVFVNNGDGTAILKGIPAARPAGQNVFTFSIQASNGIGEVATQTFTLTLLQRPAITSPASVTFLAGQANTFTITTHGFPVATLTEIGALPAGLTFIDNGDGTATVSGTPVARPLRATTYSFAIRASNNVGAVVTQKFWLIIK